MRTALTISGVPVTQPTFQPVKLNVLPALLTETVRSRIPSTVANGMCSRSYVRCS